MKPYKKWILLGLSGMCSESYAGHVHDYIVSLGWSPVITLTVGESFTSDLARSQYIPATGGDYTYTFKPNHNSSAKSLLGAYTAFERDLGANNLWQLGISYVQPLTRYQINGDVSSSNVQGTAPYHYKLQLQQLLAESKMLHKKNRYLPYISAGIGAGWVTTSHFSTNFPHKLSFSGYALPNPSYSLGAGLDFFITEKFRLGMGYRFMSFGNYRTEPGKTSLSTGLNPLSAKQVYANTLIFQVIFTQDKYTEEKQEDHDLDPE
jgi:opacity protein-like surface antigen